MYISISTPSLFAESYEPLLQDFEKAMCKYNSKPHWGKKNFLNNKDVQSLYGLALEKFIEVRKKLDPQQLFSNFALNKIIG